MLSWYRDNGIDVEDSIGIDEVGRGPLAGPVVSSAVWMCCDLATYLEKNSESFPIRDSKKMTSKQRVRVVNWVEAQPENTLRYSIASASVDEIDDINILNAVLVSMGRAYESLGITRRYALIDGNKSPDLRGAKTKTVVGGDSKVLAISIASIMAKEYRDNLMRRLSEDFPNYGWETNVGYGTKTHIDAIKKFGITPHHRKSFAPIAKIEKS